MHYTQNLDFIQNLGPLFVDYSEDHSKIAVNSISSLSAEDQPAFGDHRSKTSVEQFIFSKYKRTLNYSHLFCVVEYGGVQKMTGFIIFYFLYLSNFIGFVHCNYYPIECLRYQKFTTNLCNKKPKNTKEIIDLSGELMEKVVISTGSSTVEIKIE